MNIETRKINLAQRLLAVQRASVLDKIEALLKETAPTISGELKQALDEAIEDMDNGKGIPHDQVMKEAKKRFPNLKWK